MSNFAVTLSTVGVYHAPDISATCAEKTTSLLQRNYDSFHVFWNLKGYHNHQVHYLLTAYALGADPSELQVAFDKNADYQRPSVPLTAGLVPKLYNDRYFKSLIGYDVYFHDYTTFFLEKMEQSGWQNVVNQYLFSRTELAEDLLVRLHAGNVSTLTCNSGSTDETI
jgi:Questin oxidase-like